MAIFSLFLNTNQVELTRKILEIFPNKDFH